MLPATVSCTTWREAPLYRPAMGSSGCARGLCTTAQSWFSPGVWGVGRAQEAEWFSCGARLARRQQDKGLWSNGTPLQALQHPAPNTYLQPANIVTMLVARAHRCAAAAACAAGSVGGGSDLPMRQRRAYGRLGGENVSQPVLGAMWSGGTVAGAAGEQGCALRDRAPAETQGEA